MTPPSKKPAARRRKAAAKKVPKKVEQSVAKPADVVPAPPAAAADPVATQVEAGLLAKLLARLPLHLSAKKATAIATVVVVLAGALAGAVTGALPTGDSYGKASVLSLPAAARSAAPSVSGVESHLAQPGDTQPGVFAAAASASTASLPGCVSRFNTSNFSSRNGVAVRELVAHYTVSRNVPGWADVNGVADFLNRSSTQASASAIIDAEGHCLYTVPVGLKSWTEANANPFSFGVEFVAMGDEGKLSPAALKEGGRVFAAVAKLERIPIQLGHVVNCQPVVAGEVDHGSLGACGGGHHDLRPFYGTSVVPRAADDAKVMAALIAATKAAAAPSTPTGLAALTKPERAAAATLKTERALAKRRGGWKTIPKHLARATAAKQLLQRSDATVVAWATKAGWTALRHARHDELQLLIRG